ncbi:hypothetical protein L198_08088 [Cryptococcus wingfieldii CBS 7118]|uniref:Uncharacterized protein n=1 Tax=Cryptococcus wingfieldii CBS 7118 TaxID=1295528 RepID=A0A1E3HJ86_9TREE|nr:hypothetical protein L198_08088 [Cryptococcus wingfieldii CBS 7118]ODN76404.1 hypothetical protein L198_08088 [Cryptococcus wingfieldii CBS 7118]
MPDDTPIMHGRSTDAALQRRLQALPPELLLVIIHWLCLSPTIDTLCPKLKADNVEAFYGELSDRRRDRQYEDHHRKIEFYFHRQVVPTYEVELNDYIHLTPFLSKLFLLKHVKTLAIGDDSTLDETFRVASHYPDYLRYVRRCIFKTPEIKKRLEAALFQEVEDVEIEIEDITEMKLQWASTLSSKYIFPKLKNLILHLYSDFPVGTLDYRVLVKTLRVCHLQTLAIHGLPPDSCARFSADMGEEGAKVIEFHPC